MFRLLLGTAPSPGRNTPACQCAKFSPGVSAPYYLRIDGLSAKPTLCNESDTKRRGLDNGLVNRPTPIGWKQSTNAITIRDQLSGDNI